MPLKPIEDYKFFVALYKAEDGTTQMRASTELRSAKRQILEDALLKFDDIVDESLYPLGKRSRLRSQTTLTNVPGSSKRQRSCKSRSLIVPVEGHLSSASRKSNKRRNHSDFQELEQPPFMRCEPKIESNKPLAPQGRQLQIRVDDKKAQEKWFSDAFKAVQQVGCRTIAKVWIKKIHPKKVCCFIVFNFVH
jgi:Protein of unknown function (DUF2841)